VEAHVILVGPHAGKVKRLAAMEDGRSFKVVVSRLVSLDGQIAAVALQKLAQCGENWCEIRLYGFDRGRRFGSGGFSGWHDRSSIARTRSAFCRKTESGICSGSGREAEELFVIRW